MSFLRSRRGIAIGVLGVSFLTAQAFQPEAPATSPPKPNPAWNSPPMNPEVAALFKRACADCHSNETRWPWYARISPGSWLLTDHVKRGRRQLNFSTQSNFTEEQRGEVADTMVDHSMPPKSYLLLHPEARLSEAERQLILRWGNGELE